jgi:hypothetical protein
MRQSSQRELFDEDLLEQRLGTFGLRGVRRIQLHDNQSVMVSLTAGGVLRIHRGFAYASDAVLRAIVKFANPGTRRRERAGAKRLILSFPVFSYTALPRRRRRRRPTVSPQDRPLVQELGRRHQRLNELHFGGTLSRVRFRISHRMLTRLGEVTLDTHDRPIEIAVSRRHIERDGWTEVEHTLLHEMIHQWQAASDLAVDHGPAFRQKARAVGISPRAMRDIGDSGEPLNQRDKDDALPGS